MPKKVPRNGILVMVDFSESSIAALDYGSELAACTKAPLIVLHVVHDPGSSPGYYTKKRSQKFFRRMQDAGSEMLEEFMADARARRPKDRTLADAHAMILRGLPVTKGLQLAKRIEARLIVVGSRGRTLVERLMLGSKAAQIVRLSPIPVTVVKTSSKRESKRKAKKNEKSKAKKAENRDGNANAEEETTVAPEQTDLTIPSPAPTGAA